MPGLEITAKYGDFTKYGMTATISAQHFAGITTLIISERAVLW